MASLRDVSLFFRFLPFLEIDRVDIQSYSGDEITAKVGYLEPGVPLGERMDDEDFIVWKVQRFENADDAFALLEVAHEAGHYKYLRLSATEDWLMESLQWDLGRVREAIQTIQAFYIECMERNQVSYFLDIEIGPKLENVPPNRNVTGYPKK